MGSFWVRFGFKLALIGFVWVRIGFVLGSFFPFDQVSFLHIPLLKLGLRTFDFFEIGFVLHKKGLFFRTAYTVERTAQAK